MTDQQFAALLERLDQIRMLLACAIEGPAPSTDPPACEHPLEMRTDLSTLRRTGFACAVCGFREVVNRQTGEPIDV